MSDKCLGFAAIPIKFRENLGEKKSILANFAKFKIFIKIMNFHEIPQNSRLF